MQHKIVETEVVQNLEPIQVTGVLQFIIPTPIESMHMIHKSLVGMQQTLSSHSEQQKQTISLLSVMNTTLYQGTTDTKFSDGDILLLLQDISTKMDALAGVFASLPEWIPAHTLQESKGLSADAIRKQLRNPRNFEPEVDYKQVGKIWYINKNAIPKIRRQK